jgi:enediyne biosynthesis protein E5
MTVRQEGAPRQRDVRLAALRRFAVAITALNVAGHTVLGFEQAWIVPVAAVVTAYITELGLEAVDAWATARPRRFSGGLRALADFLLPAHITGLAVGMLLYANQRLWPILFAVVVAVASKQIFRVPVGHTRRHFLNPSNTGIAVTLLLFPWVGIAPPYHFTENLGGAWDWILPGLIVVTGTLLNGKLTGRLPLIGGWVGGFAAQAIIRGLLFGTPLAAGLLPMTGLAFVLFTNYMVTDPGTTPSKPSTQVAFGAAVAAAYGALMLLHIVFGLFFALAIVCATRGLGLYGLALVRARAQALALARAKLGLADA